MSKLWLYLNRTPKPELNKAALQPPGDFAREQFWKKKTKPNQPNTKTNTNHWKLEGDGAATGTAGVTQSWTRGQSVGGEGTKAQVCRAGSQCQGHSLGTGIRASCCPWSCPGIPAGHRFPGDRQGRAPHTSMELLSSEKVWNQGNKSRYSSSANRKG